MLRAAPMPVCRFGFREAVPLHNGGGRAGHQAARLRPVLPPDSQGHTWFCAGKENTNLGKGDDWLGVRREASGTQHKAHDAHHRTSGCLCTSRARLRRSWEGTTEDGDLPARRHHLARRSHGPRTRRYVRAVLARRTRLPTARGPGIRSALVHWPRLRAPSHMEITELLD